MTVARRFIAGSGTTFRPASRRDARIPPAINPKFRSSLRGRDQILNTSTGDKSSAYFLVVPPGHTATATALNAEMSKLQAPKAKGREITWSNASECYRNGIGYLLGKYITCRSLK